MKINNELWIIIMDDSLDRAAAVCPGTSSAKLQHDFCHLDTVRCNEIYTNYYFDDWNGKRVYPFYQRSDGYSDYCQCVSPRRFLILTTATRKIQPLLLQVDARVSDLGKQKIVLACPL